MSKISRRTVRSTSPPNSQMGLSHPTRPSYADNYFPSLFKTNGKSNGDIVGINFPSRLTFPSHEIRRRVSQDLRQTSLWTSQGLSLSARMPHSWLAQTEVVQKFHELALKLGVVDYGKPGIREDYAPDYYAALQTSLTRPLLRILR
ncbi:hypothetical protein V1522DRAFT_389109 [Lipomyces starkeyi]